jgi:DNA-binding NtrC family response regulator
MLTEEILMVNDGSLLLQIMGGLLESKGYHINLTYSPEEALVLLSTRHVMLVVMKLDAQQTDRLAVMHMVKELNGGAKLIIIGESTYLPAEIFEIEADDYILLPCQAAEIWRRLLSSLKTAKSESRLYLLQLPLFLEVSWRRDQNFLHNP